MTPEIQKLILGYAIGIVGGIALIANPIGIGLLITLICALEIINLSRTTNTKYRYLIAGIALVYLICGFEAYRQMVSIKCEYGAYCVAMTAGSDMFAYLFGTYTKYFSRSNIRNEYIRALVRFAARKPIKVSPNKTVAGFIGSAFGGIIAWSVWSLSAIVLRRFSINLVVPTGVIVAAFLGIMGQAGDLIESGFKRRFGAKDSGTILGSHGGFCDRADSLAGIFITFYLMLKLFGVKS